MRKRNKILMATVSVLLCLVLVTTCGLSGIYAKYTTKDSASLTVGFKKLGVNVLVDVNRNERTTQGNGQRMDKHIQYNSSDSRPINTEQFGVIDKPDVMNTYSIRGKQNKGHYYGFENM